MAFRGRRRPPEAFLVDAEFAHLHPGSDQSLPVMLPLDLVDEAIDHAELDRYRRQLAHLACTDPLTQLRNRLSLDDDLGAVHARSERHARPYAVAMCDIDYFKSYNDALGHQAGDQALRSVAAALTAALRQGDVVYRYGGEEFSWSCPNRTWRPGRPRPNAFGERSRHSGCLIRHPRSQTW